MISLIHHLLRDPALAACLEPWQRDVLRRHAPLLARWLRRRLYRLTSK